MKNLRFLIYVYIIALALTVFGFLIDSDTTTNSFAFQMYEVFLLSLVVFGILTIISLLFYSLFISVKGLFNR